MPLNPSAAEFKPASQPISIPLPDDPWAQEAGDVSVLPLLNVMLTVQYGPGDLRFVPLCGEFSPRSLRAVMVCRGLKPAVFSARAAISVLVFAF